MSLNVLLLVNEIIIVKTTTTKVTAGIEQVSLGRLWLRVTKIVIGVYPAEQKIEKNFCLGKRNGGRKVRHT